MNPAIEKALTIVHTEASVGWGGQEIRTFEEARWMRGKGHRVLLAAPESSEILKRFRSEGFEVRGVGFEKWSQLSDFSRLAGWFREIRPDVVGTHSNVDSRVGLLAAQFAGVPVRLRYRHISAPTRPNIVNKWLYNRVANHVLTTAECIREELIGKLGLDPGRVSTVPTGIDPPNFPSSREEERIALAHRLNLPETARFIGCVAVLRSWKGQEFLMRAFDEIAAEFRDHHLLFVGDGPYGPILQQMRLERSAAKRIHFFGHQNDPWPFFRAMDIAVLPSYKDEGIPQSLLQAMFAECAVVGTNVGGIPEIVRHLETGLLAPPKDVANLTESLRTTLKEESATARQGARALQMVNERHTRDKMGESVLKIVARVLR